MRQHKLSEICNHELRHLIEADASLTTRVRVPRGGAIYNWGDPDARIYIVEYGQVKTTTSSPDGKPCLLSIYTPSDTFGELGLFSGTQQETATAMIDTVLLQIHGQRFLTYALADEHLKAWFMRLLVTRMQDQQRTITQFVTMNSEQRLAAMLLELAKKLGRRVPGGVRVDARITQEDLASMVGTTRSRVGLFLKNLRQERLIESIPGSYLLINEEALALYVQDRRESGVESVSRSLDMSEVQRQWPPHSATRPRPPAPGGRLECPGPPHPRRPQM